MVAIFTGAGTGFERGSGSVLGNAGLLGSAFQGWGGERVSVNAATGNLLLQKQDEVLIGLGPDVGVSRTYNSLTTLADDNDDKWRQSTDRRVYGLTGTLNAAGSTVRRASADGTEITYTWDAATSAYVAKDGGGAYDRIVRSGTEWVWTDGDSQAVERYETTGTGRIKSAADRNGLTIAFTYDSSNRLDKATTSDGSWIRYDYSGASLNVIQIVTGYTDLQTSTAKTLTRTRYGYDGSNRLTTVTVDLTPGDNSVADGATYVTTYSYDVSGRISNIAQSDGSNLAVTYDGVNRVATLVQTESAGVTRTTAFTYGTLYTQITDPANQVTRLDYDASGNLTKITAPPAYAGAAQQIVQFAYNAAGDLTSTTDALGQVSTFGNFTANGLAQTVTDRLSNAVTRTYNATNLLLSETRTGVDTTGAVVSQTARFVYNAAGNLRFAITAEGRVTEYVRNAAGDVTYETVYAEAAYTTAGTPSEATMTSWANGLADRSWVQKTKYLYDARGAVLTATRYGIASSAGAEQTGEGTSVTSFVYDQAGQLLSSYSGSNAATSYLYDGMGRVVGTTDANGGTTTMVYNAGSLTTTVTLASGYVTTKTYNKAGDLVSVTDSGANTAGGTTIYAYDKLGRVRVRTDANGLKTYTIYDNAGRLVGSADQAGSLTEYRYDANDRLVGTVRYRNAVSAGTLTTLNTPTANVTMSSIRPSAHAEDISSWTVYDAEGRVLQTIAGDGSTTISTYDAAGRLQKTTAYVNKISQSTVNGYVSTPPSSVTAPTTNAGDAVARVFYDKDGLIVGSLSGEGYLTQNTYDKAGQLVATTAYATAASAGLRASGSFTALLTSVGTSAQDRTSRRVYDGQGLLRYTIDALNQVVRYDYNSAGQRTRTAVYAAVLGATSDYTFDKVKSLASSLEASSAKRESWAVYDTAGRVAYGIDAAGAVTGYIYDPSGRVTKSIQYATPDTVTSLPDLATMNAWAASNASDAGYIRQELNAFAAGQTLSLSNDAQHWIPVTAGTRLSVEIGVEVSGIAGDAQFAVHFRDSSGSYVSGTTIDTLYGNQSFGTRIGGFVTVPAGAVDLRIEVYTHTTGAGRGTLSLTKPMIAVASVGQTQLPAFTAGAPNLAYNAGMASTDGWFVAYNPNNLPAGPVTSGIAASRATRTWYTARGEAAYVVDAEGYVSLTTYDAAGRAVSARSWDGKITVADGATFSQVQSAITATGGAYALSSFEYDSLGRLTAEVDAEGTRTTYAYLGASSLRTHVTRAANGTIQEQSVTHVTYDHAGRAVQTVAAEGTAEAATSSQTYDGRGLVVSATDPRSSTTSYAYDLDGRVTTVTDAASGVVAYEYNAFGEVWKTTDAGGNVSYAWQDKLGRATTTRDAGNYLTQSSYTVFGEVASVKRWMAADTGTPAMGTEPAGSGTNATTSFTYDALGRVLTTTDALNNTESYTYDAFGNRVTSTNKLSATTSYAYDRLGRLLRQGVAASTTNYTSATSSSTSGSYIVTTYAYAARSLTTVVGYASAALTGTVTALRTTTSTLDNAGRLTKVTHDAVTTIADNMVATTTGVTPTETYAYDRRGNVVRSVDAGGAATYSYYDDLDRKVAEIRQLTASQWAYTAYAYDANGNLTNTKVYEGNGYSGTPPLGGVAPGAPAGLFRETAFTYDSLNRMLTSTVVSNAGNAILSGSWNGSSYTTATGNLTTTYQYDAEGNVVKVTDPNGNVTWSWYDALGRKTAQLDGEKYLTKWAYDAEGNVLSETRHASQFAGTPTLGTVPSVSANAADRITDFAYDLNGNRTKETRRNVAAWSVNAGTGALSGASTTDSVIQYTYNALGQVTVKQIGGTTVAGYSYDTTGRLTQESKAAFTDANGSSVTPTTTYAYDALGDLVGTSRLGTASGTYSAADRTTTYRYGEGGRLLSTQDAEGYYQTYFYDAAGRLKKTQYDRIVNADDTASGGGTTTVTEAKTVTYDLAGRALTQSVYSNGSRIDFASFEYNAFDQITRQGSGANGSGAMYQAQNKYDGAGRLIATNAGDGVWKVFAYDKNGNQTGAITSAGAATSSSSTFSGLLAAVGSADLNGTYTRYDGRGQAVQVIEEGRDLSASVTGQTLNTYRTYNAFGEIASETNALGATLAYTYNTMGRRIRSESPAVSITDETGAAYWVKPSEDYYYDLGGRLVATRDANGAYATTGTGSGNATSKAVNTGNLTTYAYLGSSGYDGSQGLVTLETHADGGKKQTLYDRMGDVRVIRDELYNPSLPNLHQEERSYNRLGQVIEIKHNRTTDVSDDTTRLIDSFKYDQFGQRIQHGSNAAQTPIYGTPVTVPILVWNGYTYVSYGSTTYTPITGYSPAIEKTSYDALGRITRQADFLGQATITTYAWDGALTTSIGGASVNLGGWVDTTSYTGTTRTSTVKTDLYTRELYKSDLGGHVTTNAYDAAGRLAARTTGTTTQTFQWYNTGLVKENVSTSGTETYGYDAVGQRTSQLLVSASVTLVDAQASYDALGRLTTWNQNAATYANGAASYTAPQGTNTYAYDAVGNVRNETSSYGTLDNAGAVSVPGLQITSWFRYDAMNRLVVDKGGLSGTAGDPGTTIIRGGGTGSPLLPWGTEITYDAAGQRTTATVTGLTPGGVFGSYPSIQVITPQYYETREFYNYDGAGRLTTIQTSQGAVVETWYFPASLPSAPTSPDPSRTRSEFSYDLLGRQTAQSDFLYGGSTATYSRTATYAVNGFLLGDSVSVNRGPITTTTSTYSLTSSSGEYFLGSVARVNASYYTNGAYQYASTTVNDYQWWDGVMQNSIATTQGSTTYTTSFTYDGLGRLTSAYVGDNRPRTVSFRTDGSGQIIRRDERDNNNTYGDPHEIWYRFGARQMSYVGNNGTSNVALNPSITGRRTLPGNGAFRYGALNGANYADTTNSYDAINSFRQGSSAGSYTVQQTGDTLAGIAQALWGDASLWYKLAEANGLSADTGLVEGQRLTVPQGVIRNQFNAGTVKPYDPAAAIGDVSPSTPQPPAPPQKKGCGILGQIFLAIIAVAVAVIAGPQIIGALKGLGAVGSAVVGGALTGAASSVVSQGIGVMTGIQDKFSWKGVALGALSGAVGGGIGQVFKGAVAGSQLLGDVLRGAATSALTQGIAVATGLQDQFSWAGVAAAGIGNGVGLGIGRELAKSGGFLADGFGNDVVSTAASALANAATRSAIEGSNFGDNILAALPDAIGSVLGRALGRAGGEVLDKAHPRTQDDPVGQAPRTLGNEVADAVAGQDTRIPLAIRNLPTELELNLQMPDFSELAGSPSLSGPTATGRPKRAQVIVEGVAQENDSRPLPQLTSSGYAEDIITLINREYSYQEYKGIIDPAGTKYNWSPSDQAFANNWSYLNDKMLKDLDIISTLSMSLPLDSWEHDTPTGFEGRPIYDPPVGDGGFVFNFIFDGIATGGVGILPSLAKGAVGFAARGLAGRGMAPAVEGSGVEALYQARYASAYERGLAKIDAQLAAGEIRAPAGQPDHLFRANRVDAFARADLKAFALEQGHGTDLVRVNQRLHLVGTSGPYRVPDLYFPQSRTIFDGTLGTKTLNSLQIIDFRTATGNAPIGIVRPESYGGFYWLGK